MALVIFAFEPGLSAGVWDDDFLLSFASATYVVRSSTLRIFVIEMTALRDKPRFAMDATASFACARSWQHIYGYEHFIVPDTVPRPSGFSTRTRGKGENSDRMRNVSLSDVEASHRQDNERREVNTSSVSSSPLQCSSHPRMPNMSMRDGHINVFSLWIL
jgi:hypothetical protein